MRVIPSVQEEKAMKRLLTVVMLLMVGVSIAGCMQKTVTPEAAGPSEAAPPPAAYRFEDLPVPASMNLVRSDSYIFEAGGFRAGILVYEGKDDPAELVILLENMLQHNWKLSLFLSTRKQMVLSKARMEL
jgi:hypothetical protein